jgi:hypothetical protein|tara:strand:- start:1354 stop:1467 length:114 start_codon:yes stop_codon:yes gene_type:complete
MVQLKMELLDQVLAKFKEVIRDKVLQELLVCKKEPVL